MLLLCLKVASLTKPLSEIGLVGFFNHCTNANNTKPQKSTPSKNQANTHTEMDPEHQTSECPKPSCSDVQFQQLHIG